MTPLQQYVAEEIATDHVDGLLTRREALRRLALLGLGGGAAAALIAACGGRQTPRPSGSSGTSGAAPPGMDKALPTEPISWPGPRGQLLGAWAQAHNARRGVLVVHENKGLNDWVRSVAGRFAGAGYSALAIDLLSEEGGTGHFADPAQATAALSAAKPDRFIADLNSGINELQMRVPGRKIAVVGFCFGGGLVWQLLASGAPELSAAVPFYGPLPDNPDFAGSDRAAVLALYGALDTRVTRSAAAAKAALERAGLVNDIVIEPNADHAFFNDTGPRYNAAAADDAWGRVLEWFGRYLA
ncbi:dienelactone hydrolase family protein [Candidatus Mycobacterium methanotrophicum]|uniref:Dienelactone hydrolase family protein n=1 Tax=Candidatus Mycobacterium methanotrophicum TaxID=2943498 RepID=A0ABY4QHL3_9MYCO|nr:dienelactone hydrolase family protein [Candidatus Mycobacterium methanotrophicum]UQX09833.1 dienelactone hydrolase family protein [Candidatus Mycobacterium methanotrophicum]